MNPFIKLKAYMAIQAKVKQADLLFRTDGKRRFVIPFVDGSVDVLSKDEALTLKKQGQLPQYITAKTLYGSCFYWTDTKCTHASVKGKMPFREQIRRRKIYYQWYLNLRAIKQNNKTT